LLVRYRTTRHGTWQELRQMLLTGEEQGRSITYTLGIMAPTLASRSSGSAQTGAGGIRALNDGVVPSSASGAGRQAGPGPLGAGAPDVPLFTWSGSRGPTQWVQYVFPDDQQVSSAEVFWVRPPKSWRVIYQESGQWKEVSARGAYGTAPNAFSKVEFAPVRTMAVRLEAVMEQQDTVSVAEWRVGPEPTIVPATDLKVNQTFTLDGDFLDWHITLTNDGPRTAEIGDLAVPFNFAERTAARGDIYTRKLLRHAFVGGHGSFAYWQRSNGVGPYLVMTPAGDTKFEYYDSSGTGAGGFGAFTPHARDGCERRRNRYRRALAPAAVEPRDPAESHRHVPRSVSVGEGCRRCARCAVQRRKVRHRDRARNGRTGGSRGADLIADEEQNHRNRGRASGGYRRGAAVHGHRNNWHTPLSRPILPPRREHAACEIRERPMDVARILRHRAA
jgi:hypothetical protein